eukprot:maker-scaffold392_size185621-snap-gene-0.22 protein:Tk05915 transcript:maker-scaffold392_size185621-snap-gene-0.22-mRNA-1 annotation:"conserved hypothetical protein"
MDGSSKSLIEFLTQEKHRAQERIRQCQVFLHDPNLDHITVRESLEQLRSNAEDDFGTFLHLLTVYRSPDEPKNQPQSQLIPAVDKKSVLIAAPVSESSEDEGLTIGKSRGSLNMPQPVLEEGEDFELHEYLTDPEGHLNQEDPLPESAQDNGDDDQKLGQEEDDFLTGLPPPSLSGKMGVPMGRFMTTTQETVSNMARSLPVSVPINHHRFQKLPPELEEDEDDDISDTKTVDIHNSIQNIAKSLHVDVFGELPRPRRMFQNISIRGLSCSLAKT